MGIRKKRVDEDWKRQAEEEKSKIDTSMAPKPRRSGSPSSGAGAPASRASSRVSILSLVEQLAAQAMSGLGQLPDPRTGQLGLDLDLARDAVDMITLLQEKTQGNLDPDEDRTLGEILHSLRMGYSSVARQVGGPPLEGEDPAAGEPTPQPPDATETG